MTNTKAVVFDAYGTLFDVSSIAGACRDLFGADGDRLCALWRSKQLEYTWLRSLMGRYEDFDKVTNDALRHCCTALGLELNGADEEELMRRYDHLDTYPENVAALRALAGYRLMILSNGTPSMLAAVVKNNGLESVFERLISVRRLGVYKPDPRVYLLACDETGLQPDDIAFVSSNYFDIAGAAAFGYRAFWVNRRAEKPDMLGSDASAVLDSLAQLPTILTSE
mgnify:CR=1 FL=1|jgi:2-haloacid dehalogenase